MIISDLFLFIVLICLLLSLFLGFFSYAFIHFQLIVYYRGQK